MRFLENARIADWCLPHNTLRDDGLPEYAPSGFAISDYDFRSMPVSLARWLADRIIDGVGPWQESLLVIYDDNEWNRQNWHLYYRLRSSYGDNRLLDEARGHLFLEYEQPDLLTFVQVALLNDWRIALFTAQDYGRAFVMRDGAIRICLKDAAELEVLSALMIQHLSRLA